jgi:16S rRNA (uracil1498-N3)-methyltransferase
MRAAACLAFSWTWVASRRTLVAAMMKHTSRDVTKLPRVYLPSQPLQVDTVVQLDPDLGHYLQTVMRLKVGQSFRAFNGADGEYLCTLEDDPTQGTPLGSGSSSSRKAAGKKALTSTARVAQLLREQPSDAATLRRPRVVVYVAALKKPRLKLLLEKVTELGVADVVLVTTQNSEASYDNADALAGLRAVCVESAEQSERLTVPGLSAHVSWKQLPAHWGAAQRGPLLVCRERFVGGDTLLQVLLEKGGRGVPLPPAAAASCAPSDAVIGLFVGPEGGFTQDEVAFMAKDSETFRFVTLGDGVLRAETAAINAVCTATAAIDFLLANAAPGAGSD